MRTLIRLSLIGCCLGFHLCLAVADTRVGSTASTNAVVGDNSAAADPFAAENAPAQPRAKISDPLERVNRGFFWFNDKLYCWVLKPASHGYSKVAPRPVRTSVQRFFVNLRFPIRFVNNLLQGKPAAAGKETARFVMNSTVGIAGFADAADKIKLKPQPADFDQTLGVYGLRPGFYFDWPILGPSSLRGSAGIAGDTALTPWTYLDWEISIPVRSYEVLNTTSLHPGEYEDFKKAALDPYVALRSAYYDSREAFIQQGRAHDKSKGAAQCDTSTGQSSVQSKRAASTR